MDEAGFRAILATVSLMLLGVRIYHAWKLGVLGTRGSVRRGDQVSTPALITAGSVAALASMLYILMPGTIDWAALPLPASLRWLGVGRGLVTIALFW